MWVIPKNIVTKSKIEDLRAYDISQIMSNVLCRGKHSKWKSDSCEKSILISRALKKDLVLKVKNSSSVLGAICCQKQILFKDNFIFSKFTDVQWNIWVSENKQIQKERSKINTHDFWRSPTTTDVGREKNLQKADGSPWDGFGRAYRPNGTFKQTSLNYQVEFFWPTPTTQDSPHYDLKLTSTGRRAAVNGGESRGLNLCDSALTFKSKDRNLNLNPRWVEGLMGLPIGWTMISTKKVCLFTKKGLTPSLGLV